MNITITKKENPGKLPETDELGFGKYFTDHMFLMDYSDTDGWHNARIVPFGPVSMSPAAPMPQSKYRVFMVYPPHAIWLMRLARNPAPKPLSIFTTETPLAQELSMDSSADTPPKDAP